MKKLVMTIALFLALGTATTFAQPIVQTVQQEVQQEEFVKIKVEDLPEVITNAVKENYEGSTIEEAYVLNSEGVKTYKVIIQDQDENSFTLLYNEKGEKLEF